MSCKTGNNGWILFLLKWGTEQISIDFRNWTLNYICCKLNKNDNKKDYSHAWNMIVTFTVLTVRVSVLWAVRYRLHAQALVDVSPVVVPKALQPCTALVLRLARRSFVIFRHSRIIFPWITNVLKAGVVAPLVYTITVVYTCLECSFFLLYLAHAVNFIVRVALSCHDNNWKDC